MAKHTPPPGWKSPLDPQQPLANPGWMVAALAGVLIFAAFCVYVTFCLLFWQGQWQLVFKPSATITATPAAFGLHYDEISFDATETGVPQLQGWWVPQESNVTLLLLHGGSGSLSDVAPQLRVFHQLGLNVFGFDYRGFGRSAALHPSQTSTYEDAEAAWQYLTETRHLGASTIVVYGQGLGAAIAVETVRRHPQAAALILEDAVAPTLDSLELDRATRLLPVHLLFHDRFDPREALAHLPTQKFFLAPTPDPRYYEQAAPPKQKAMTAGYASAEYEETLRSFLKRFVPGA